MGPPGWIELLKFVALMLVDFVEFQSLLPSTRRKETSTTYLALVAKDVCVPLSRGVAVSGPMIMLQRYSVKVFSQRGRRGSLSRGPGGGGGAGVLLAHGACVPPLIKPVGGGGRAVVAV